MSERGRSVEVGDLRGHRVGDSVALVAEGIVSAIPLLGGPLAVVVSEIRVARDKRIPEFLVSLQADLVGMGERLDEDFVGQDEFQRRVEQVLEQVVQARHTEKRDYYRRALAGTAAIGRPSDESWQLLVDALESVQPVHLRVLARLMDAPVTPGADDGHRWEEVQAATPDLVTLAALRVWDGLASLGILEGRSLIADPVTETESTGIVTPFGRWFAEFLGIADGGKQETRARRSRKATSRKG